MKSKFFLVCLFVFLLPAKKNVNERQINNMDKEKKKILERVIIDKTKENKKEGKIFSSSPTYFKRNKTKVK